MIDISPRLGRHAFHQVMAIDPRCRSSPRTRLVPSFHTRLRAQHVRRDGQGSWPTNGGVIHDQLRLELHQRRGSNKQGDAPLRTPFASLPKRTASSSRYPKIEEFIKEYAKKNPFKYADISDVADHIDRVVELVGVDHVGFGSDFDGVGDSLPTGLKSPADYPNLIRVLLERDYSRQDIEKICSGNVLRVWSAGRGVRAPASRSVSGRAGPSCLSPRPRGGGGRWRGSAEPRRGACRRSFRRGPRRPPARRL